MPTDTRMCTVNTADEVIMVPYLLKHSRRARYIRLSLDGANLAVLTIPPRVTEAEAVQFLRAQGDWLKSNFGKVKKPADTLGISYEKVIPIGLWEETRPLLPILSRSREVNL